MTERLPFDRPDSGAEQREPLAHCCENPQLQWSGPIENCSINCQNCGFTLCDDGQLLDGHDPEQIACEREQFLEDLDDSVERGVLPDDIRQSIRDAGELPGRQLVSLMRRYRITIRELSQRTGITQKRIRQVRSEGLKHSAVIRDWIEAIIGADPGPVLP